MGGDLTPTRTGKIKRPTITSVDEAVEKSKPTLEWKMICCFGKQFGSSSKCQNYHVYVPSVTPTYIPREMKICVHTTTCM